MIDDSSSIPATLSRRPRFAFSIVFRCHARGTLAENGSPSTNNHVFRRDPGDSRRLLPRPNKKSGARNPDSRAFQRWRLTAFLDIGTIRQTVSFFCLILVYAE